MHVNAVSSALIYSYHKINDNLIPIEIPLIITSFDRRGLHVALSKHHSHFLCTDDTLVALFHTPYKSFERILRSLKRQAVKWWTRDDITSLLNTASSFQLQQQR